MPDVDSNHRDFSSALPGAFKLAEADDGWRRIFLMRHAAVVYFDRTRPPLHPNEVTLSEDGRQQAASLTPLLAANAVDRVWLSPLRRTRETAEIVLGGLQSEATVCDDLEEIRPGHLSAIDPKEAQRLIEGGFAADLRPDARFLQGETFGAFLARVVPCFEKIAADRTWHNSLIVAHGGVNRAILTHVLGSGLAGFARIEQDPAAVNIIDLAPDGRMVVRLMNWTPYRPLKSGSRLTTMELLYREYLAFIGGG